jgi:murein tripeptide amidase MpaA
VFRSSLRGTLAAGLVAGMALAVTVVPASAAGDPRSPQHEAALQAVLDQAVQSAAQLPESYLDQLPQTAAEAGLDFAPRLVLVNGVNQVERSLIASSGLDVTEHAGHDYVEVVISDQNHLDLLDSLGFDYEVKTADLVAREYQRIVADAEFARLTTTSALPSGRDTYRVLADFGSEIDALVTANPDVAKRISLGLSYEGRDLTGIEITSGVNAPDDGRPVFLMFGNHHAREWPSAETPMEFAYTVLNDVNDGDARTIDLLTRLRIVIVPVSNPDGYLASRESGDLVDLTGLVGTDGPTGLEGTLVILATPGNAYKRKNCNNFVGTPFPQGVCTALSSPGGYGIGVDLNRNYGALWGGPGADAEQPSAIYRGSDAFSEPETQAIRTAISSRQVTTLITNHTFSNLLLRPVGVVPTTVGPDDFPIGFAPDECFETSAGGDFGMKTLGEVMTAQTGYSNQFGWELYDTTGTTEDYSYNATGGYGYTFEIGPDEFHPPFENVVNEYTGNTDAARGVTPANAADKTSGSARACEGTDHEHTVVGGGLAEAYYQAALNAANPETHSIIAGKAPTGATITVSRTGTFPLWDKSEVTDTVTTSMTVPAGNTFEYHVNPSTRPFSDSRAYIDQDAPAPARAEMSSTTNSEIAPPGGSTEIEIVVGEGVQSLHIDTELVVPSDDIDLELYAPDATLIGSSGNNPGSAESIRIDRPLGMLTPGSYLLKVINFVGTGQHNTTISQGNYPGYVPPAELLTPRTVEQWTVTCTIDGTDAGTEDVTVDRGDSINLSDDFCVVVAGVTSTAPDPASDPNLAATGGGAIAIALLTLAGASRLRRREDGSDVAA